MKGKTPWIIGGLIVVVLFVYLKGKSGTTSASSVVNAPNTPTFTVTSMGHSVNQNLPLGQITPNEPGTAPIIGGQYA
jgi:hypothetical protein